MDVVSEPGLEITPIKPSGESNGDAGDQYFGLVRFGRLEDARWIRTSDDADRERVEFDHDRLGNVTWQRNREAPDENFDERYNRDTLYRVGGMTRGKLDQNRTTIGSAGLRQNAWNHGPITARTGLLVTEDPLRPSASGRIRGRLRGPR